MDREGWWAHKEVDETEHTYEISMLRDKRRTWNKCKEKKHQAREEPGLERTTEDI